MRFVPEYWQHARTQHEDDWLRRAHTPEYDSFSSVWLALWGVGGTGGRCEPSMERGACSGQLTEAPGAGSARIASMCGIGAQQPPSSHTERGRAGAQRDGGTLGWGQR